MTENAFIKTYQEYLSAFFPKRIKQQYLERLLHENPHAYGEYLAKVAIERAKVGLGQSCISLPKNNYQEVE